VQICVIGAGYVGLVAGTCLANFGHKVVLVDRDQEKVTCLKSGGIPIFEPGLAEAVAQAKLAEKIGFTSRLEEGMNGAELVFVAVDTPNRADGSADLSRVLQVAREISQYLNNFKTIILKSTVPVGGTRLFKETLLGQQKGHNFALLTNPEFLREGSAIYDFLYPDRVIIGTERTSEARILADIYEPISKRIVITTWENAELIKYASNAFLATKISFINEIAGICEKVGGDINKVAEGIGYDSRIGPQFLKAGVGYGGSCLPKDIKSLIATGKQLGCEMNLLQSVVRVNLKQRHNLLQKLFELLPVKPGLTIGIWGLSFKPDTDDIRESPALDIVQCLKEVGCRIKAFDPVAMPNFKRIHPDLDYGQDPYETVQGVEALLILTEWKEFMNINLNQVKNLMTGQIIIDGRNIFDPQLMKQQGFTYCSVGR
jgi:UDPglucose 6-dehydrogenase